MSKLLIKRKAVTRQDGDISREQEISSPPTDRGGAHLSAEHSLGSRTVKSNSGVRNGNVREEIHILAEGGGHEASSANIIESKSSSNILIERDARIESPVEEGEARPDLDEQLENMRLESHDEDPPPAFADATCVEEPATTQDDVSSLQDKPTQKQSKFTAAFGEVKHFAGGLVSHPYEATRHYSILRHSYGFVFYQGPTTSVAITVFSDRPLPSNRKLWLQKRGFSGKTGLRVGAALGSRSSWIDVTPSIDATLDLLPKSDERAWQRDIAKFLKKAKDAKHICKQRPCETDIVRVPHVAQDGYFRVVLCSGRNVLCPSPVFRYASSSTDPTILRGASLSTLSMELAIRIGLKIGRHAANTAAHGALLPAINTVQTAIQPYQLNGFTEWAATTAYDTSGAAGKVDGTVEAVRQQCDENRDLAHALAGGDAVGDADIIGDDDGPEGPYPIRFSGKVARGSGESGARSGFPTVELFNVSEETLLRLAGVYMGWASISKTKLSKSSLMPDEAYETWYQAVVMVKEEIEKQAKVVAQKSVSVYILNNFGKAVFFDAKVDIMLMAFIRPSSGSSLDNLEQQQAEMLQDIATTKLSLNRPAWELEMTLERIKTASSSRSFTERVADARTSGQRQIDRVPLHRIGVRTGSMGLKDQLIGNGGLCVRR